MDDREFDLLLEEMADRPPAADYESDFTPWRRAMNRVLWGWGLVIVTLNFWNLDLFLPMLGHLLMVLGFRSLRLENRWFRWGLRIACLRALWCLGVFFANISILRSMEAVRAVLLAGNYIVSFLGIGTLLCMRNGIRAVQCKAGLPPHGGTGMLVWYAIMLALAIANTRSVFLWGFVAVYFFLLRGLVRLSRELDNAGYAITAAPVSISDGAVMGLYALTLAVLLAVGYGFCGNYPMTWEAAASPTDSAVRQELQELGMPDYVLQDLTDAEAEQLQGAQRILVDVRDYDIDQGRGIGTLEEILGGKRALLTDEEGQRQLRITQIGIQYPDEREHWTILHHFLWLEDRTFRGTEALHLVTTDHLDGWTMEGALHGRVLCDGADGTMAAPYYSLGPVTYEKNTPFPGMFSSSMTTEYFASFSLPHRAQAARGYVFYDVLEAKDGYILDSWCSYVHQHSIQQLPVLTAAEFEQTVFGNQNSAFRTIDTAFQAYTHEEEPGLLD